MQESTRTKTDAKGRFTLDVPDQGMHLVRVTHDKANYFRPAPPGTQSVEIEVFSAQPKVEGVSTEANVMRIESDASGNGLHVVENFFVKNESNPPKTQFSERAFEFFLPPGAVIEGSAALAPGGMPVQASPVPLGDPNHFAFIFPIRPGETRFQVTYRLPYNGSFTFTPKLAMPTDTVAVMMPKAMTFKPGAGSAFVPVTEETTAQTFVARNVAPSQSLEFTVSGSGQLPRDQAATGGDNGGAQNAAAGTGTAATDTRPGGGLGNPIDPEGSNDPWAKYKWWILGGLGLAMAAGAGVMLKNNGMRPAEQTANAAPVAVGGANMLLATLKDELFAVETDRLQGKLGEAEYREQKAALETVLRRALARSEKSVPVVSRTDA